MGCEELGVSVKYYAHNELTDKFFLCLLLAEPLMKIHFVNLVKAFLVQLTRFLNKQIKRNKSLIIE